MSYNQYYVYGTNLYYKFNDGSVPTSKKHFDHYKLNVEKYRERETIMLDVITINKRKNSLPDVIDSLLTHAENDSVTNDYETYWDDNNIPYEYESEDNTNNRLVSQNPRFDNNYNQICRYYIMSPVELSESFITDNVYPSISRIHYKYVWPKRKDQIILLRRDDVASTPISLYTNNSRFRYKPTGTYRTIKEIILEHPCFVLYYDGFVWSRRDSRICYRNLTKKSYSDTDFYPHQVSYGDEYMVVKDVVFRNRMSDVHVRRVNNNYYSNEQGSECSAVYECFEQTALNNLPHVYLLNNINTCNSEFNKIDIVGKWYPVTENIFVFVHNGLVYWLVTDEKCIIVNENDHDVDLLSTIDLPSNPEVGYTRIDLSDVDLECIENIKSVLYTFGFANVTVINSCIIGYDYRHPNFAMFIGKIPNPRYVGNLAKYLLAIK